MIFMEFKVPHSKNDVPDTVWLAIEHIESVREAYPEEPARSYIGMNSGDVYEVEGYAEDIVKGIVREYRGT